MLIFEANINVYNVFFVECHLVAGSVIVHTLHKTNFTLIEDFFFFFYIFKLVFPGSLAI